LRNSSPFWQDHGVLDLVHAALSIAQLIISVSQDAETLGWLWADPIMMVSLHFHLGADLDSALQFCGHLIQPLGN
jgi:hypothetical protein